MGNKFNIEKLTPEQVNAALACKTAEELIALAKENGVELSAEDAKKYLAQMADMDVSLSDEEMRAVAGGQKSQCAGYCIYDKW